MFFIDLQISIFDFFYCSNPQSINFDGSLKTYTHLKKKKKLLSVFDRL